MSVDVAVEPNLLVVSDLHLGSDLQEIHSTSTLRGLAQLDRDLGAFLDYYVSHREGERPWRLVIAGDLVDFIGMAIRPQGDEEPRTSLTPEEVENGLGSAADHVLMKLRRVIDRHGTVFAKLAAFVGAGNEVVVVRGNHDVEFFWDEVREEFRNRIAAMHYFDGRAPSDAERETLLGRIQFAPWFYYLEDLVYIEHGHQYDEYCSFDYVLNPVSPTDPRRLTTALSDVLLRDFINPTTEMPRDGHENWHFTDYARWLVRIGFSGLGRVAGRYAKMIVRLLRIWWEGVTRRGRAIADEHGRRMSLQAQERQMGAARVERLHALRRRPMTRSLPKILATFFLDRLMLAIAVCWVGFVMALVGLSAWEVAIGVGLAAGGAFVASLRLDRWRTAVLDAAGALRESATRIRDVVHARYIVMGHTHQPVAMRIAGGGGDSWYFNVGTWASESHGAPSGGARPAPMTHLVLLRHQATPAAELRQWDVAGGRPRPYQPAPAKKPR